MTLSILPKSSVSDSELITASRNGNRDAFGQIVRRYQAMVSGLIYAACGDLHRSEDLAQETFISAWKSLSGLRDPAKLPGWLCQIARHRIADHFREPATQRVQLQQELEQYKIEDNPADHAVLAEENELLWRTLARIPQPYRETLVLYYRQGRSTAEVAAAMETTDEGVRQRLARGRKMLREELAAMVERNLAATAPGQEFALAVVAALPMAAAQSAAVTATAKGSAAAKSGGVLLILANWIAPIMALGSMSLITFQSIRRAQPGRAKYFIVGYWLAFWSILVGWIFACAGVVGLSNRHHWDYSICVPVYSGMGCIFAMALFSLMVWGGRRAGEYNKGKLNYRFLNGFWLRFLFIAPCIYLGVGWTISMAISAGDHLSAELISATAIIGCAISAWRFTPTEQRRSPLKMAFESWFWMVAIWVLAMDFRLHTWIAATHHLNLAEVQRRVPLWSINLFAAILLLWMALLTLTPKRSIT